MKKSLYILMFLGVTFNFCLSQTEPEKQFGLTAFNSKLHARIYRVQIDDYQNMELIEFKNGEFNGSLFQLVWKINRKETRKDSIFQKLVIPHPTVKKMISDLHSYGFENLKNCDKVENCISGLDGKTVLFKAIKDGNINSASYWELESDYYYNENNAESPAEVIKARKLISIINKDLNLKERFEHFLDQLPKGRYSYGMLIMRKGY